MDKPAGDVSKLRAKGKINSNKPPMLHFLLFEFYIRISQQVKKIPQIIYLNKGSDFQYSMNKGWSTLNSFTLEERINTKSCFGHLLKIMVNF